MNQENLTENIYNELNSETQEAPSSETASSEQQIDELNNKIKDLEDQLKRSVADYQNLLRRTHQERDQARLYASEPVLSTLIPALDNFYFALKSFNQDSSAQVLLDSLKMIWGNILSSLEPIGFKLLENAGSSFDPNTQEAIAQIESEDKEEGLVLEVFRPGYSLNGKTLRPSQVTVSKKAGNC